MISPIVIIDYGLGNLFSVVQACKCVGIDAVITDDPSKINRAATAILPGVGAFGEAMALLSSKNLIKPIKDFVASGKTFIGICLGMQLLMTQSNEFGIHKGLGFINGSVEKIPTCQSSGHQLKVPHIGWNSLFPPKSKKESSINQSEQLIRSDDLLKNISNQPQMYFVHSYYVNPEDQTIVRSLTTYGQLTFCSSFNVGNVWGFQFHPEKSGPTGLAIYHALSERIIKKRGKNQ